MNRPLLALLAVSLFALPVWGEVRLARVFTDHAVLQRGVAVPVWGWAEPGAAVTVRFGGQDKSTTAGTDGRWLVRLDAMDASAEPRTMTAECGAARVVLRDILVGEVWMCCGQSNMARLMGLDLFKGYEKRRQQIADANVPTMRFFQPVHHPATRPMEDLEPRLNAGNAWQVFSPETAPKSFSLAYFFGRQIHDTLKVPVGLIQNGVSGTGAATWVRREVFEKVDADGLARAARSSAQDMAKAGFATQEDWIKAVTEWEAAADKAKAAGQKIPAMPGAGLTANNQPFAMYNGMVHPLAPYAIRGLIWHRGEAGASDIDHARRFNAQIADWRGDFFVIVGTLTNIGPREGRLPEPHTAHLIDEQYYLTTQAIGRAGIAVLNDLGNSTTMSPEQFAKLDPANGVHYEAKDIAGARYALMARGLCYGEKDLVFSGPVYESMTLEGGKARLKFKHAGGGLVLKDADGENRGFVIEDEKQNRFFAQARIDGPDVLVWHDQVPKPTVIYYGFHSNPRLTLFNKEGLPALSFRTANVGQRVAPPRP